MTFETCQGCDSVVPVDSRGRTAEHDVNGRTRAYVMAWSGCSRSGHPSREELARRKARRQAKRAALVVELQPVATVALDALIEGRPEYQDRIDDLRRAALYEFNRANRTKHRHALDHGDSRNADGMRHFWWCRFCRARLHPGLATNTVRDALIANDPHLTQCALEYLADLRPIPPAPPVLPEE